MQEYIQITLFDCIDCDFTGVHCTTSNGDPVTDACSCFYTECIDGHTTNPIPVEGMELLVQVTT